MNPNFNFVELHAAGELSIYSALKSAEVLSKHGYVDITRIKTNTIIGDGRRAAKIQFQLTKTAKFEELNKEFQEKVAAAKKEREEAKKRVAPESEPDEKAVSPAVP